MNTKNELSLCKKKPTVEEKKKKKQKKRKRKEIQYSRSLSLFSTLYPLSLFSFFSLLFLSPPPNQTPKKNHTFSTPLPIPSLNRPNILSIISFKGANSLGSI